MNYKIFLLIFLINLFLFGCNQYSNNQYSNKSLNIKLEKKYKNIGFSLIYDEGQMNMKKLDGRSLQIYHKTLKKKSLVKITNPENGKSLIAEVKSNKVKFSDFYNSVITNRISETLELDRLNPYIEINLISKNSTFIAKKSKTFEEEKKVAEKAPIDGILINDLNLKTSKKKKVVKKKYTYFIKVADFYYEDTAKIMIDRIRKDTLLKNSKILRLSETKYRVIMGPFNDINKLKESFEKMKLLNFENLEIIRNV